MKITLEIGKEVEATVKDLAKRFNTKKAMSTLGLNRADITAESIITDYVLPVLNEAFKQETLVELAYSKIMQEQAVKFDEQGNVSKLEKALLIAYVDKNVMKIINNLSAMTERTHGQVIEGIFNSIKWDKAVKGNGGESCA